MWSSKGRVAATLRCMSDSKGNKAGSNTGAKNDRQVEKPGKSKDDSLTHGRIPKPGDDRPSTGDLGPSKKSGKK